MVEPEGRQVAVSAERVIQAERAASPFQIFPSMSTPDDANFFIDSFIRSGMGVNEFSEYFAMTYPPLSGTAYRFPYNPENSAVKPSDCPAVSTAIHNLRSFKGSTNLLRSSLGDSRRVYRYLLQGGSAFQTPGTPPTDRFTALRRRKPCVTPASPGKSSHECPVHGKGLQILFLNKFINHDIKKWFRGSYCDILINEHGIFRVYRVVPEMKHKRKPTRRERVPGAFGIPGVEAAERRECEHNCLCWEKRGLRISIQLAPFFSLGKECWLNKNWSPRCKHGGPWTENIQQNITSRTLRPQEKVYCQCRSAGFCHEELGPLLYSKAFWAVRANICKFLFERYRGMTEHHDIALHLCLEIVGFQPDKVIAGDLDTMMKSVLEPFYNIPKGSTRRTSIELWPRKSNPEGRFQEEPERPESDRRRFHYQRNAWPADLNDPSLFHAWDDLWYPPPEADALEKKHPDPILPLAPDVIDVDGWLNAQEPSDEDPLYNKWLLQHMGVLSTQGQNTLLRTCELVVRANDYSLACMDYIRRFMQDHLAQDDGQAELTDPQQTRPFYADCRSKYREITGVSEHAIQPYRRLENAIKFNKALLVQLFDFDDYLSYGGASEWNEYLRMRENYLRGRHSYRQAYGHGY